MTTILVALLIGSAALADQSTRSSDPKSADHPAAPPDDGLSVADRFAAIDTDGDGRIDEQEARAALERLFVRMDEDQSGSVAPDEFSGFHLPGRANPDQKGFKEVDLDGNGRIDRTEYIDVGMMRFGATDVDGRPGISLSEYRAFAR